MLKFILGTTLATCAVTATTAAQSPVLSSLPNRASSQLQLRYASFDPLASLPEIPEALQGTARDRMHVVQFRGVPTQAGRDAIAALGGEVIGYLPTNAYVVRVAEDRVEALGRVSDVRWVGDYHPAFRLDPELIGEGVVQQPEVVRYNVVVADKRTDKPALISRIKDLGGVVESEQTGSLLIEVSLSGPQLLATLHMDEVLWIDRWSAPEEDMDNARIQGGGNYIESLTGYTGAGVNAHIYEGIEASHPDFTGGATNVRSSGSAQSHGHATGGIVFGNGTSNPAVRGMAPDAGKFYTNYGSVSGSRYQVVSDLVNVHNVSHTTASWGGARTFFYTSTSAESDDIVFDHDIAWTQSQSNAGNQDSRPQAWAKNVFSIGGVRHNNNSNPGDDSWAAGGASIGPASDGRIKPTLCAYYDSIGTSDRTGSSGYSSGNWYSNFGGTSGATPIVAGHNVIAIQMFTDEVLPGIGGFGQALRVPGGTSHENRPHFTTLKALQVVNARQYNFSASSSDNRREHQGWGFPNLQDMYDNRNKTYIIDETQVITQGETQSYSIDVEPGEAALKVCLNWNEPAGNPSASSHLVNNLSLRVTSPTGTQYWGNHNLENGRWSTPGGSQDNTNSIENVFVQNPTAGEWQVEVTANAIVQDSHVETPAVDADYALVIVGGLGDSFGSTICPGAVNSLGVGAVLDISGSSTVADNDLTIEITNLPLSSTGYAITSMDANLITNPGGSFGDLCIAGPTVGRFLGYVLNSGSTGEVSFSPDLTAFPTPMGTEAVMPGDTRYFQYWYRDSVFGFPVSNFSSAMRLTFD